MQLLTAIIYTKDPQYNGRQFLKYRKIKNTEAALTKFENFARQFPGAWYVNYYDRESRRFHKRRYLIEQNQKQQI